MQLYGTGLIYITQHKEYLLVILCWFWCFHVVVVVFTF